MTDGPEHNARRLLARMAPVRQPGAFVFAAVAHAAAAGLAPAALGRFADADAPGADAARRLEPWLCDPVAGWTADDVRPRFVARRRG